MLQHYLRTSKLRVARDHRGRPYLEEADGLRFNLSRSGGVTLVAVSREADVGVDLERRVERDLRSLPAHALCDREREVLDGLPEGERADAFLTYWVRKEAVLKAAGVGLGIEPNLIEVSAPSDGPGRASGSRHNRAGGRMDARRSRCTRLRRSGRHPPAQSRGAPHRGLTAQRTISLVISAVVFDMDGVIVDTEQVWDEVREELVAEWGGRYSPGAQRAMMGMSSGEWSRYLHDEIGLPQAPEEISDEVVRRMLDRYRVDLPLIDGAVAAVRELARSFPLAVASSSNRPLIDAVLETAGIADCFAATVSSEEVARGKPSPDVYLEAARRLGVTPTHCVAVEDSANGIRAAAAAGLHVIAYPNRHYPPDAESLALADAIIDSLGKLAAAIGVAQASSRVADGG